MTDGREVVAAVARLLRSLDWSDTTLDAPRYRLAELRGLLEGYADPAFDEPLSAEFMVPRIDALAAPRGERGPLFGGRAEEWLAEVTGRQQ